MCRQTQSVIGMAILLAAVGAVQAAPDNGWDQGWYPMPPGVDPVVNSADGRVTSQPEWISANAFLNIQEDGTFRAEWQRNWKATSSSNNQTVYPGVTLFDMHDLWGYTTQEVADYNVFEYTLGDTTVKAWIFANGDEPDDAWWIGNAELGSGYSSIDDRGFLVRLNNNPATDVHWLPGDPEPGDVAWNWNTYYGLFGSAGFNDSAFQFGLPLSVNGSPNEVYEVALYSLADVWVNAGGGGGGGGGGGFQPCVHTLIRRIKDPKLGAPSLELEIKVDGPGHVIPEPTGLAVIGLALVGLTSRRRDR